MILCNEIFVPVEPLRRPLRGRGIWVWLVHLDVVTEELVSISEPPLTISLPIEAVSLEVAPKMLHFRRLLLRRLYQQRVSDSERGWLKLPDDV